MILKLFWVLYVLNCANSNESPRVSLNPQKLVQKAGQQTYFSCLLQKGSLPVQFEWLHDEKFIQSSPNIVIDSSKKSSNLIFESLSASNAGNYTCRASNNFGSDVSTSNLIVEGPPQWQAKPSDIRVGPKERFNIQCIGIGHPSPTVIWKKQIDSEWRDLSESSNVFSKISPTEIAGNQLNKEKDEGKYGCEISNGINPSLWTEFMIKVSGKTSFNLW
ncbi:cell adhesion molecule Dscam1-like [Brevipalpus obovatus]|uniref:cell adhesion molecule Dscam1-like n=1 Tax=Brevipalpus obovatus TaxID=246614 RepID=UPI003D9F41EE